MDTEAMTALDDEIDLGIDSSLISVAPFSPPSLSASQYKQLELLQHLSLYSELLILFSGEKGMGKTFIAQALIASREAPDQSLMVDADFSLSYLDILHKIAQHIDLPELDDVGTLEQQFVQYCEQILSDDQGSFLLIIDQADQLTNQTLLHLNQLALMQPNALHVMLLATPILDEVLLDLPEPHAPLHIMHVEYLVEDESEIILLEQFPEQDWSGEQVDYMLQQSKGSPGKLMYIAQRLIDGAGESGAKVKAKFPITHIAAMLLVASILVVSFLYKNSQPVAQHAEELVITTPVLNKAEAGIKESTPKPIEIIVEDEVDFNFIEPTQVAVANTNIVDSAGDRRVVPSPVTKQPTVKQVKVDAVKGDFSDAEKMLISATPSSFIAQLFGSHSEKSAKIFVQENQKIAGRLLSYRTEHKGKSWFVVVSGPFESKEAAKEAVGKLPAKLREQKPWVRSIEPVQALLGGR